MLIISTPLIVSLGRLWQDYSRGCSWDYWQDCWCMLMGLLAGFLMQMLGKISRDCSLASIVGTWGRCSLGIAGSLVFLSHRKQIHIAVPKTPGSGVFASYYQGQLVCAIPVAGYHNRHAFFALFPPVHFSPLRLNVWVEVALHKNPVSSA